MALKQIKCSLIFAAILSLAPILSRGQGSAPLHWNFKVEGLSDYEIVLAITAKIAPGWHLYSQHLKEGGPQPTRLRFHQNDAYIAMGQPEETGKRTTFYDDIYEMEITWYSETASFLQKFRLNEPITTIIGVVEYMTCNNQVCVPQKKEFEINVNLLEENP